MRIPHKYTPEERAFMKDFVPGHSYKEIQAAFEERFGILLTLGQVNSYIGNNGLKTGRTGRFEKGHTPYNKGEKLSAEQYAFAEPTMFKKGHKPHNTLPIGTEITMKDGFIKVKVAEPNKWKLKHVLVWEKHYGNVPAKHCIVFIDRNRQNCDISNLMLIKRNELRIMNRNDMFTDEPEINRTMIHIAKCMAAAGISKFEVNEKNREARVKNLIQKRKKEV